MMKTIKRHTENAKQWLAYTMQTSIAHRVILFLIALLGLVLLAKGIHTAWFWSSSVSKMEEQFIPTEWAKELTGINVVLQLVIGLSLVVSPWFSKARGGALAAVCSLLFVYAAYSRIVQVKWVLSHPPCACIGWLEGMSWSDVLRTNIILLVLATVIWFVYPKEERRSIPTA